MPQADWARTLRAARQAAHLSREQLARRAGLSAGTIRNIETRRRSPTSSTVAQLLAVHELCLVPPLSPAADFAPNLWLAPEFDPIKMARELERQINGRGGHVDQSDRLAVLPT